MPKKSNKKVIQRENWISQFTLIGKPKITDYTFKIDEKSNKSAWIYNSMNLGVDCGELYGTVYSEMSGGYSDEKENIIFCHGKDDEGNDDFNTKIEVNFDDRFNEDILESIGKLSFITVGLEKTDKGKTFYKNFLSAYDAIAYIKEHLTEDMVVNVKGNLKYSTYQDRTQVRKNITSIVLSRVENESDFVAEFTQTVLLDKSSASLKNIDKDKGVMYVDAKVLDYMKEFNGIEVGGQFPFNKQFEFPMNLENEAQCKMVMEKLFKVKKGITQITFVGNFIEGGAVATATWDDVPQNIRDLVTMGLCTKEEVIARCSSNGSKEQRMVLKRPHVKLVGEEKAPVLQVFPEQYTEEDLVLDYLFENQNADKDEEEDEIPFDTSETSSKDNSMDWLNNL